MPEAVNSRQDPGRPCGLYLSNFLTSLHVWSGRKSDSFFPFGTLVLERAEEGARRRSWDCDRGY